MVLKNDRGQLAIESFVPNRGATYNGAVTVEKPTAAMLGSDVDITIDGKTVNYSASNGIVMIPNVTYTFGSSVDCHVMD